MNILEILNEARSPITSGIIYLKGNKILGIKGKKDNAWDIPKGQVDKKEEKLKAARRETQEEIGIKPKKSNLKDLGSFPFMKNRKLHLYLFVGNNYPKTKNMEATNYVKHKGKKIPEKEKFQWIPVSQIKSKFKKSLISPLLKAIKDLK